jgi:Rab-like protein 5
MKNIEWLHTNLEDDGENLREDFSRFLGKMLSTLSEKREQEELGILNS